MANSVRKVNYRFSNSDGNVYTEDGVIIRKIYISQVPVDMDQSTLWEKFSKFGEIQSVVIKKTAIKSYALITYVYSKDATKALKAKLLNAEAADTWRQPITSRTDSETTRNNNNEKYICDNKKNLLHLDDDSLLHIFSYLNIYDLIKLEKMCSRFFYLMNNPNLMNFYKRYRAVDLDNILKNREKTLMEQRIILIRIGKYIRELTLSGVHLEHVERILDMIPKYCKNLVIINFTAFSYLFNDKILIKYLPIFNQLKEITLSMCDISDEILIKCFTTCTKMLKLNLSGNHKLTGKCLIKIKNLIYLDISECRNIKPEYFSKFCLNNKTLKYLNIRNYRLLNDKNCLVMSQNLINLEHLTICGNYPFCITEDLCKFGYLLKLKIFEIHSPQNMQINFDNLFIVLANKDQLEIVKIYASNNMENLINPLSKFTKLKELKIRLNKNITDDGLCNIVKRGILTTLEVRNCSNITNAGILKCVELCPDLKSLTIYGCQVDKKFILLLPEILKSRKPRKKITINVSKDLYNEISKCHKPFMSDNKNLLTL